MGEAVTFEVSAVLPQRSTILAALGVPPEHSLSVQVEELLETAAATFRRLAAPVGLLAEISGEDFAEVFHGEGRNAPDAPLPQVLEQARSLVLFAVTVGGPVCQEISRSFAANEPAQGTALDAYASAGVELLPPILARQLAQEQPGMAVLPYSPGYCGWDVTGQRRLFAALRPQRVGISLGTSCLMQPLKSISGVLVAAPRQAHEIEPGFSCCVDCATQECRQRYESLEEDGDGAPSSYCAQS